MWRRNVHSRGRACRRACEAVVPTVAISYMSLSVRSRTNNLQKVVNLPAQWALRVYAQLAVGEADRLCERWPAMLSTTSNMGLGGDANPIVNRNNPTSQIDPLKLFFGLFLGLVILGHIRNFHKQSFSINFKSQKFAIKIYAFERELSRYSAECKEKLYFSFPTTRCHAGW